MAKWKTRYDEESGAIVEYLCQGEILAEIWPGERRKQYGYNKRSYKIEIKKSGRLVQSATHFSLNEAFVEAERIINENWPF